MNSLRTLSCIPRTKTKKGQKRKLLLLVKVHLSIWLSGYRVTGLSPRAVQSFYLKSVVKYRSTTGLTQCSVVFGPNMLN